MVKEKDNIFDFCFQLSGSPEKLESFLNEGKNTKKRKSILKELKKSKKIIDKLIEVFEI